jgi:acyl-coenzyme A thioesterase PaaI-like protein
MKTKLPNASHCFVCGLENPSGLQLSFYVNEERQVESQVVIGEQFQGYPGVAHGGIVATILDETLARALMADDPNRLLFTGRLTTRYRKPTPVGEPLRAVGVVLKDRGRMAECASFLYNQDGELLAQAEGLMVDIPPEMPQPTSFEGMSWKVYPDDDAGMDE